MWAAGLADHRISCAWSSVPRHTGQNMTLGLSDVGPGQEGASLPSIQWNRMQAKRIPHICEISRDSWTCALTECAHCNGKIELAREGMLPDYERRTRRWAVIVG